MCAKILCVPNNIFLSKVTIMQITQEKADLQKTKVDNTTIRKFLVVRYKLSTGKEWRL